MKLRLIGRTLGHSWSGEIHGHIIGADYRLLELEPEEVGDYLTRKDYDGLNVTIPYKKTVIPYLDEIDPAAERMQAVNCIVNDNGLLKGYNTDIYGLNIMLDRHNVNDDKLQAAILGSGGAARMAAEVCRQRGWSFHTVSRSGTGSCITYDELYRISDNIDILINATPAGMFPDIDALPADPGRFSSLKYAVDIVANPVRTRFMMEAEKLAISSCGGLEMLVGQAFAADELFTGSRLDPCLIDSCLNSLRRSKLNIVLIGMPSSGKTTIAGLLSQRLGRRAVDTDSEIVDEIKMPVSEFFSRYGEEAFRRIEHDVCRRLSTESGIIIATGGGAVKGEGNMRRLAANGIILWIDRSPDRLIATASRPLSSSREALNALYEERRELYERYCDYRIENNASADDAVRCIMKMLEHI